jgi:predicted DNA-binding transcriptional regulator AlpA
MKVIGSKGLREKGITYSREQIYRLVREGKFPKPFKLADRSRFNYWDEEVLDRWLEERTNRATPPPA